MVQLCKTPLLVRHGFHRCYVSLPLPCISFIRPFLVLQFATGTTAVTDGTSGTARITGTTTDIVVVTDTAAAAVVTDTAAIIACVAAVARVHIHAAAYAPIVLSCILPGSTDHPAFSFLLHTGGCTIHTLRLSTNHTSTVHTTTLTWLK